MTDLSYSREGEQGKTARFALAAIVAVIGVFLCPLNAGASIRNATGNACASAGVSAAVVDRIFGAGTSLGIVTGAGPAFCAVTPARNAGSGYIEVIAKPKSALASLIAHYAYQGQKSPLMGLGAGAIWYHQGPTAESVIFTTSANAFAIAVDIAAKPFPTKSKLTALASAIRIHFV